MGDIECWEHILSDIINLSDSWMFYVLKPQLESETETDTGWNV